MQTTLTTISTNESIIEERNQQINSIMQEVEIVNEIYKDLALLVHEQGGHINTIYDNIETSLHNTQSAVQELEKAKTRQSKCSLM